MAVRVKLVIERSGVAREVRALVNTGYEADSPQLMIPISLARELGLWPPTRDAQEYVFDTAGGPVRVWYTPRALQVRVVAGTASSKPVTVDVVVSPYVEEPLISDVLASELEIVILDPGRGLWRFKWEPENTVHESA